MAWTNWTNPRLHCTAVAHPRRIGSDLHLFSPWVVGPAALALRKWRRLQTSERNSYQVSEVKKGGKPAEQLFDRFEVIMYYIITYTHLYEISNIYIFLLCSVELRGDFLCKGTANQMPPGLAPGSAKASADKVALPRVPRCRGENGGVWGY